MISLFLVRLDGIPIPQIGMAMLTKKSENVVVAAQPCVKFGCIHGIPVNF